VSLNNTFLEDLSELKRRGALDRCSSVIEIGAQQLSNNFLQDNDLLSRCCALFGKEKTSLGSPIESKTVDGVEQLADGNPTSRQFWQSIGFAYASVEFDGHRDSIPLDLNYNRVRRMRAAFDLIVNTGTTEHVANQDNAFRVMHDLCKLGGIMYHQLPAGGMMTHGLVTYTPKFFWHLCRENHYEALILRVSSHDANPVPQDVRDSNLNHVGHDPIPGDQVVPDFMIVAVSRKHHDKPFVMPLDLPADIVPARMPLTRRLAALLR
jgi:hypothetical protein